MKLSVIQPRIDEDARAALKTFFLNQLEGKWGLYLGPVLMIWVDGIPKKIRSGSWQIGAADIYVGDKPPSYSICETAGIRVMIMIAMAKAARMDDDRELREAFQVGMAKAVLGMLDETRDMWGVIMMDSPEQEPSRVAFHEEKGMAVKSEGRWFLATGEEVEVVEEFGWTIGEEILGTFKELEDARAAEEERLREEAEERQEEVNRISEELEDLARAAPYESQWRETWNVGFDPAQNIVVAPQDLTPLPDACQGCGDLMVDDTSHSDTDWRYCRACCCPTCTATRRGAEAEEELAREEA